MLEAASLKINEYIFVQAFTFKISVKPEYIKSFLPYYVHAHYKLNTHSKFKNKISLKFTKGTTTLEIFDISNNW